MKTPNAVREKAVLLAQMGMTDKEAVKAHLVKETTNITDPLKMEMRLDRVAHSMIMNFFDGDRQFVAKSNGKEKTK
jgi:hypothetical protein